MVAGCKTTSRRPLEQASTPASYFWDAILGAKLPFFDQSPFQVTLEASLCLPDRLFIVKALIYFLKPGVPFRKW